MFQEKYIPKNIILDQSPAEKALLLAVSEKGSRERQIAENSLEELALLAASAGAKVVGKIIQQLPAPSHDYLYRQRQNRGLKDS